MNATHAVAAIALVALSSPSAPTCPGLQPPLAVDATVPRAQYRGVLTSTCRVKDGGNPSPYEEFSELSSALAALAGERFEPFAITAVAVDLDKGIFRFAIAAKKD